MTWVESPNFAGSQTSASVGAMFMSPVSTVRATSTAGSTVASALSQASL